MFLLHQLEDPPLPPAHTLPLCNLSSPHLHLPPLFHFKLVIPPQFPPPPPARLTLRLTHTWLRPPSVPTLSPSPPHIQTQWTARSPPLIHRHTLTSRAASEEDCFFVFSSTQPLSSMATCMLQHVIQISARVSSVQLLLHIPSEGRTQTISSCLNGGSWCLEADMEMCPS